MNKLLWLFSFFILSLRSLPLRDLNSARQDEVLAQKHQRGPPKYVVHQAACTHTVKRGNIRGSLSVHPTDATREAVESRRRRGSRRPHGTDSAPRILTRWTTHLSDEISDPCRESFLRRGDVTMQDSRSVKEVPG